MPGGVVAGACIGARRRLKIEALDLFQYLISQSDNSISEKLIAKPDCLRRRRAKGA